VHGGVDELAVAETVPGSGPGQQVRRVGHRLHPAGDNHVELAVSDQLVGQRDRVQARQADLVHRDRGHGHRDAAADRGLPGGDLSGASLQHVPHDHVVDLVRGDPGFFQRGLDGDPAEVDGLEGFQGSGELSDRRAGAASDDRTRHEQPPEADETTISSSAGTDR